MHNENKISSSDKFRDDIVTSIYNRAKEISESVVNAPKQKTLDWNNKLDDILTSKWTGFPIML